MSANPSVAFKGRTRPGDNIIRLEHIRKTYRVGSEDVHALAEITMPFSRGSFWAIMGPSGSGKSTLLNLLGCLDRPTKGRYFLHDRDISTLDDDALSENRLRHLGFIFQSFHLIPQLTVLENIELPLFYLGVSSEKSILKAEKLAHLVGLDQRLHHRPNELSGGQQQRVAIARALANDPEILLADEPTGNLDTATGQQIMQLLQELHRRGKTIIMVTHEEEIADYAENRLYMRDGRVDHISGRDNA
jgi:putative ABC transport system ATP-binding protein